MLSSTLLGDNRALPSRCSGHVHKRVVMEFRDVVRPSRPKPGHPPRAMVAGAVRLTAGIDFRVSSPVPELLARLVVPTESRRRLDSYIA